MPVKLLRFVRVTHPMDSISTWKPKGKLKEFHSKAISAGLAFLRKEQNCVAIVVMAEHLRMYAYKKKSNLDTLRHLFEQIVGGE